jgi:hypothetical protein
MMLWLVRAVGAAALLVLVVALYMGFGPPHFRRAGPGERGEFPGGFRGPVLSMEFVRNGEEVEKIVGLPGDPDRATLRRKTMIDLFWIACYSLLFVLTAVLLGTRQFPFSNYLACVAAVCALSAGGFDVAENRGMLHALQLTREEATVEVLRGIREAALLKWALSFVAMGLLALTFFGRDWGVSLVGYCFAAAAAVGFVGLWHYPTIELSVFPLLLGLILLAAQALARPGAFLPR